MGIGNSRKWYAQQPDKPSLSNRRSGSGGGKQRRGFFRRRRSIPAAETIPPAMVLPISHRPMYGSYAAIPSMPIYAPLQPMPSPYLQMRYNNYAASPYMSPQPMMIPTQRMAPSMPASYLALPPPSMSTPYTHRTHVQHAYNHMQVPRTMPAIMTGGVGIYPSSYPSVPMRLLTDWTGGGKISPGFLGPPI